MQLDGLLSVLRETAAYQNLLAHLHAQTPSAQRLPLGVLRAARAYVLGALAGDWQAPILYVTARPDDAYNSAEQLPVWIPAERITRFNEATASFYERSAWGANAISGRIAALSALLDDSPTQPPPVVVVSARALMQRTLPASTFRKNTITLQVGGRQDLTKLLHKLNGIGYESVSQVLEPGTYCRRGGIVDVYPITATLPVRIEFFDDEIDSLRTFAPDTQRSISNIPQASIPPAREALPELTPPLASHLREWFGTLAPQDQDATSPTTDATRLEAGTGFTLLEHYLPYLYHQPVSLLDYAPHDALIVVDDWEALRETVESLEDDAETIRADKLSINELPPDYPRPYLTWQELETALNERRTLQLSSHSTPDADLESALGTGPVLFGGLFLPGEHFGGMLKPMLRQVKKFQDDGQRIVVVTEQAKRLADLWHEQNGGYVVQAEHITAPPAPATPYFVHGVLREGWAVNGAGDNTLYLFTDAEIFGWRRSEPRRRKVAQVGQGSKRLDFSDWREEDYVVHEDYGVGQFAGMRRRTIDGIEREYLMVNYQRGAQLFVPIHQADRLTRYVGPDEKPPSLTLLGSPEWGKTKGKAQKNVEEEARELLELYASRAKSLGYAFSPDSHWQNELEAAFPYIETEDQLRTIREIKRDMEAPHPMDRLICGDAGYGKTEVAVRAAFKAVQDGKQVAVLVPTTVLAQQHYETFAERMAAFPVKVEQLSRFRTPEEQNKIIDRIASGDVDVVVGTHRILSKDILFKDLGLVIIDEEQRFGVKQKEHFKHLRTYLDVITMTATPIPRTMHMALTGVRDISMIQTPPEERLPIITHVGAFDRKLIRSAITRELERSGQVFFVHNRVRTIYTVEEQLNEIVPEARTIVAHGQMDGRTLGAIMRAFARGEYDVLVATSIIESGIDIPNANTLIVDRADWFGLAQLYQIRGRVGRGAQQAYAYIFHPPHSKLSEEALARLETVAENTQLGAGFQIAMRDLEIRGAGDILSTRQSGHMAAVGLLLYTQMLQQAVERLKRNDALEMPSVRAKPDEDAPETVIIDLPTPAYIPTDYIPEIALRLQLYRRMAALETLEDVQWMREELTDRFGTPPPAVLGLLFQIDVKILALAAIANAVQARDGFIKIRVPYLPNINREALAVRLGDDIRVTRTHVEMPLYVDDMGSWQPRLLATLERLAQGIPERAR